MTEQSASPEMSTGTESSAAEAAPAKPRRGRGRAADAAALAGMAQAAAALSAHEIKDTTKSVSDMPTGEAPASAPAAPRSGTSLIPASKPRSTAAESPKRASDMSGRSLPLFAAALCLTLGIGGALGTQIGGWADTNAPAPEETARLEKALPWKRDVAEAGARDSGKLRDELRALRSEVAALRNSGEQLRQNEAQKQLGEIRNLRTVMESQKSETASLKADVSARFDRADHDAAQRSEKLHERVDRMEKRLADPAPTASIAKPAPMLAANTAAVKAPVPELKAEKPLHGIVLRDVARGVALIESRRGMMEVAVGDQIPGAGRVEAIEKRQGKWRVVTSTGVIDDLVE